VPKINSNRPQKTAKSFLEADPRVLRFNALEIESKNVHINITGSSSSKSYGLLFYLSDETMEIRLLKKTSHDEPTVLVGRQRIPKNTSAGQGRQPRSNVLSQVTEETAAYLEPSDLLCGSIVEIYGRKFLIVTCDELTRDYYQSERGIEQREVVVEPSSRADSKLSYGERQQEKEVITSLQVGEKDLLPQTRNQTQRRSQEVNGMTLRCKCELLTGTGQTGAGTETGAGAGAVTGARARGETSGAKLSSQPMETQRPKSSSTAAPNYRRGQTASHALTRPPSESNYPRPPTGQWFTESPSRLLLLTFYLEDLTIALNEENPQNSLLTGAGTGKSFLRRNQYVNELSGSYCEERDLYLGNTLRINGFLMKVVEVDEAMWKYCQERGDEFVYFNINFIVDHLLEKVSSLSYMSLS
jgi:hypothetical protein